MEGKYNEIVPPHTDVRSAGPTETEVKDYNRELRLLSKGS